MTEMSMILAASSILMVTWCLLHLSVCKPNMRITTISSTALYCILSALYCNSIYQEIIGYGWRSAFFVVIPVVALLHEVDIRIAISKKARTCHAARR